MRYPQSKNTRTPNIVTDKFIGVSRKAITPEGSFADCENVASDNYPGICTSAGYEDVSTEFSNIQAMVKPPEGENSFCGVADGKVYWKGEELIFAPKSNFTVQKDSKIVLYLLNKYLFIYEMRKSGFCVLYQYDTANRNDLDNNYIIVCYQRYRQTAGSGLCLCMMPASYTAYISRYPGDYYEEGTSAIRQRAWILTTDKYYYKQFDVVKDSTRGVFGDIQGTGYDDGSSIAAGDITLGKSLILLGDCQNPDIIEKDGLYKIMYHHEDTNEIPDKASAVSCYAVGGEWVEDVFDADELFAEYEEYKKTDINGREYIAEASASILRVVFYSGVKNEINESIARDVYGSEFKRVNPLHWVNEDGTVYPYGTEPDTLPLPIKVGGLYLRDEILPQITFPCIYKNRMWAGRIKGDGIVATSWGSGWNFFSFDDISSDSIEIAVTSDGAFTGLKEYNDSLLCFKENRTIVIYGDTAYNFAIGKEIENIGCIDIRSCVAVDGVLYFLGKEGFYSYSGGWPQFISKELNTRYVSCIAFTQDGKYYAEGTKANGEKELVVYDTRSGIWLLEKAQGITGLCAVGNDIYIAAADGIKKKRSSSDYMENDEEWFFESSDLYEGIFENKGILEITVRAKIKEDCTMTVSTIDSNGDAEEHGVCYGTGKLRTYRVPVKLTKDEAYRYRISGDGPAMIYDIERKVSAGGRTIGE